MLMLKTYICMKRKLSGQVFFIRQILGKMWQFWVDFVLFRGAKKSVASFEIKIQPIDYLCFNR